MRKTLILALLSAMFLWSGRSEAFGKNWEGEWLVGIGAGFSPGHFGLPAMFRLRLLNFGVPLALETSFYCPYGVGANLLLDIFQRGGLRVHALDLGLFVPFAQPERLVRMEVDRSIDVTIGAGMEYGFKRGWVLAVDYRFFFPNPTTVPFRYGGFSLDIYRDTAKGGHLWVTFGRRF
jgi:hypothetical protein